MLALIDGDVFAYKACKNREGPSWQKTPGIKRVFSKEEDTKYLMESWNNFQKEVEGILELCFATEYLMAVKSPTNFRDIIFPLEFLSPGTKPIDGYKANRWKPPGDGNSFVPAIRKLAVHEGLAIEATNREADDMLRIWANQAEIAGDPYIVASNDKDLKCIHGMHIDVKTKVVSHVSKLDALRFSYQQLLSGDSTDNIRGLPGIGPVKAQAYVANIHDEEELQELVVEMYMSAFSDDWYNMLMANGKLIYLQKHSLDHFSAYDWPVVQVFGVPMPASKSVTTAARVDAPTAPSPVLSPSPKPAPQLATSTPKLGIPTASKTKAFTGVIPKCRA